MEVRIPGNPQTKSDDSNRSGFFSSDSDKGADGFWISLCSIFQQPTTLLSNPSAKNIVSPLDSDPIASDDYRIQKELQEIDMEFGALHMLSQKPKQIIARTEIKNIPNILSRSSDTSSESSLCTVMQNRTNSWLQIERCLSSFSKSRQTQNSRPPEDEETSVEDSKTNDGCEAEKSDFMREHEIKFLGKSWKKRHFASFPFGKASILIPIFFAISALCLSVLCKKSTHFVTLQKPMFVSGSFEKISKVGLFHVELCLSNQLVNTDIETDLLTVVTMTYHRTEGNFINGKLRQKESLFDQLEKGFEYSSSTLVSFSSVYDGKPGDDKKNANVYENNKICSRIPLNTEMVKGKMWNISRVFVSWTTGIGFLFTTMLCTATFWKTINLSVIALGLQMTYFSQVLAFFFYDSDVCERHGCINGPGTNYVIASSTLWFLSGMGVLRVVLRGRKSDRAKIILCSINSADIHENCAPSFPCDKTRQLKKDISTCSTSSDDSCSYTASLSEDLH